MGKLDDYPESYNVVDFPYRAYAYDDKHVAFESRRTREVRLAPRTAVSGMVIGRPIVVKVVKDTNLPLIAFLVLAILLLSTVMLFR